MKAVLLSVIVVLTMMHHAPVAHGQAKGKIDSLRYQVETARHDSTRVKLLIEISRAYTSTDIQSSLQFGEKALNIAEKSADKEFLSKALFNMGIVAFEQGILDISINFFYRYLDIEKEMEDQRGIAGAYANIGAVYLQLNQFEQSQEYFEKALDFYNTLPFDESTFTPYTQLITIFNNLGIVSQKMGDFDLAIDYYSHGISLARKTPQNHRMLAMLLNNLGSVYIEQEQPGLAFEYLSEAFKIRQNNDDDYGLVQSYRMIATHYIRINQDDKALEQLRLGYNLAGKVGNMTSLAQITELLHEVYQRKQIIDSAYKYHVQLAELNEKLNHESALKELSHLAVKNEFKENERILKLEQKRKELRYLLIGITLALVVAVTGLLYYLSVNRNRRLKLEKEIAELNAKNLAFEKSSLENMLEGKDKELATNVMYQIQKNELINQIVEKLQKQADSGVNLDNNRILEVVRNLEKAKNQSVWDEFEIRFQQVNKDFYDKLHEINPNLTNNERRLCAFLSLHMTTKEISSITGQSPRTIDVARTRLRKKLNLTNSEAGLVEFLAGI